MLGKVFGYAAIVRCKRTIDQTTATKCAEGLVHIANKKSFLRELAANVLLDLTGDCIGLSSLLTLERRTAQSKDVNQDCVEFIPCWTHKYEHGAELRAIPEVMSFFTNGRPLHSNATQFVCPPIAGSDHSNPELLDYR